MVISNPGLGSTTASPMSFNTTVSRPERSSAARCSPGAAAAAAAVAVAVAARARRGASPPTGASAPRRCGRWTRRCGAGCGRSRPRRACASRGASPTRPTRCGPSQSACRRVSAASMPCRQRRVANAASPAPRAPVGQLPDLSPRAAASRVGRADLGCAAQRPGPPLGPCPARPVARRGGAERQPAPPPSLAQGASLRRQIFARELGRRKECSQHMVEVVRVGLRAK